MTRRGSRVLAVAAAATLALGGLAVAQDEPVTYTACLDAGGALSSVAVGDEPLAACEEESQLASWNQQGPEGEQGPPGEQGPEGEQGEKGDDGTSATYFVTKSYTDILFVSGNARCDEGDLVTGGGYRKLAGPATVAVEDYPSGKRGWTVSMVATDGSMASIEMEVFAVCSDREPLR